ncbi:TetR/AcrR family transcriptional regulator [Pseudomonas sp. LS44]|uniref:TetR/AcrR family transcriptional regulator n=1 Tax=Pseudomonas sp. LS44 TaxID=1357074 RepID=UPI00215AD3E6|nr:TetR/AcrR family transcriptional regulator [Pseudomonas sp. LS44]UVE18083.1 TetR/AcrR family transcriptional regulator [Pseudomonas sp. LS44]
MAAQIKTRERIIQASLELFNSQGERSVTTNHIAAHLGISPGNLYYHFRNKQAIIAELFAEYESHVDTFLRVPEVRALTIDDKTFYLEALLAAMWRFRFMHRDLEHLLEADPALAAQYRSFSQRCLSHATAIYQGFVAAGILRMNAAQIEALTLNSWIIMTSWVRFLCTTRGDPGDLNEDLLRRGIYQVLALEGGYLAPEADDAVQALYAKLYVPLEQIIPPSADAIS